MRDSDLDSAMRLKEAESWNQTEDDWRFFLEQGPDLCLVATTCEGEVVGTVTAINYNDEIAWIGMMLVSRRHRRMGIGSSLLGTIIDRLQGCVSIKLDATPAGAKVYRKLGFKEECELTRLSVESLDPIRGESYLDSVESVDETNLVEILKWDKRVFGSDRSNLIMKLARQGSGLGWIARSDGKMIGYMLGRRGTRYTHLGPIVAVSTEGSKAMIAKVAASLEGMAVVLDIPSSKSGWQDWLAEMGFSKQRSLYRMYLNCNLSGSKAYFQYAICGPEFG